MTMFPAPPMPERDAVYRRLLRPLLFAAGGGDAEAAHRQTLAVLAWISRHPAVVRGLRRLLDAAPPPGAARRVFGLDFPAPVGVAAGLDKDGVALPAWPALGFGFVEAGTVTAVGQPGNPRPRVFRLPASRAVINRMGFPNEGAAALARRIRRAGDIGVPLGVSLGKSKLMTVDAAIGDYLTSLRALAGHADYVAVNVSSPNTPGLRGLQDRGALDALIAAVVDEAVAQRSDVARAAVPVLVKIAPDLTDRAIADVLQVCTDRGVAGVIATNTTLERSAIDARDRAIAVQEGGLSGHPLCARSLQVVRSVTAHTTLPVIGVGGITRPADGLAMLDAGAALVQLYTGLVFAGPSLVRGINRRAATGIRRAHPPVTGPGRDAGSVFREGAPT